jgi:hypothetical protein
MSHEITNEKDAITAALEFAAASRRIMIDSAMVVEARKIGVQVKESDFWVVELQMDEDFEDTLSPGRILVQVDAVTGDATIIQSL